MKEERIKGFLKTGRIILFGLAVMGLALLIPKSDLEASYQYRIRLFAGRQGTFNETAISGLKSQFPGAQIKASDGNTKITVDRIEYGSVLSFTDSMVTLSGDKYLVRGLRKGGRDNNTVKNGFKVTEDQDYVLGYYMADDVVSYTIRCVDADNKVIQTTTHYGNAGDTLVVAFPYIEGYIPRAYNGRINLTSDPDKNVFYFPYRKATTKVTETEEVITKQEGTGNNNSTNNNTTDNNGNNTVIDDGGGNTGGGTAGGNTAGAAGTDNDGGEPEDTVDIANNEIPQAEFPGGTGAPEEATTAMDSETPARTGSGEQRGISPVLFAVLAVLAGAVIVGSVIFVRKRNDSDEDSSDGESASKKADK